MGVLVFILIVFSGDWFFVIVFLMSKYKGKFKLKIVIIVVLIWIIFVLLVIFEVINMKIYEVEGN